MHGCGFDSWSVKQDPTCFEVWIKQQITTFHDLFSTAWRQQRKREHGERKVGIWKPECKAFKGHVHPHWTEIDWDKEKE